LSALAAVFSEVAVEYNLLVRTIEVIVPKMVKRWLNGLWDSLATVPQPRKIKGIELYASEAAFTRCKARSMAVAKRMCKERMQGKTLLSTPSGREKDRGWEVSKGASLAL